MAIEVKYALNFEKQLKRLGKKYPSIYQDVLNLIDLLERTRKQVRL